jgi:Spy/CpxP family protein refolding chaperone
MKKWMVALAVMIFGTTLAVASPREGGRGGKHDGKGFSEKFSQKLNLSEAQKVQIDEIHKSTREQNAAFFDSMRQTRQEYRAAKKAGDTAKADSLEATMKSNRAQMKQIHEATMERIGAVLTPEQKAQFEAMKAERGQHRGKHRHGGHHEGQGRR